MPLRPDVVVATRPRWLTAGTLRLAILCAFIVAVGMVRPRLTPDAAGALLVVGTAATGLGIFAFLIATRRLAAHLPLLDRSHRITDAALLQIRRIGLPLLGLVFFLFWTFVYLGVWWYRPNDAFSGLGQNPRFADFFYYAVSTAFVSPPGDILASSRGARSATMIEMLAAFALLTAYLSSFIDWRRADRDEQ